MKSNQSSKLLLGLLVSVIFICFCAVGMGAFWLVTRAVSGGEVAEGESFLNHIAFVGVDGNLWLATPDGEEMRSVTADGRRYRFPTWSPDSRRLAFIGPDDAGNPVLYSFDDSRDEPAILYNDPDSAPFYIYWSPDSRSVTFLTQEFSSLAMRLADAENPGMERVMAEGAPFYWTWSPEGDQLFMHVGGSRAVSEEAHLSFLEKREGARRVELKLAPGGFQAPLWSGDGQYVFYIATSETGGDAIYRTDMETSVQTLIARLDGAAFMVLSPDDRHIAFLQLRRAEQLPILGTAYLVDTEGQNQRQVFEDWVVAMYWSPDGKKLALLTLAQGDEGPTTRAHGLAAPLPQINRLRWWIYDVQAESLELLTSFVPTLDFIQTVPYFDQYHLSLTFWSPDSRYLVITARDADSQDGAVWVLDTTGQEAPRKISEGSFAVWSWR